MIRVLGPSAAALAVLTGLSVTAGAATITDTYWGGKDPRKSKNQSDVIGDKGVFNTHSMEVNRDATGKLVVTVNTNFAGMAGTSKSLGYGYGALFFSTTGVTLDSSAPNFLNDKYVAGRFDYAFVIPQNPGKGNQSGSFGVGSSTGGLFALNDDGSDITLSAALKKNHTVRLGQAVQFNNVDNDVSLRGGGWSIDKLNKTISFIIDDGGLLGTDFALSWAMTCGNDVIIGNVALPNPGPGPGPDPVPLPAGFILFATGAAALGLLRRRGRAAQPPV
jgi:hypothetical protein